MFRVAVYESLPGLRFALRERTRPDEQEIRVTCTGMHQQIRLMQTESAIKLRAAIATPFIMV